MPTASRLREPPDESLPSLNMALGSGGSVDAGDTASSVSLNLTTKKRTFTTYVKRLFQGRLEQSASSDKEGGTTKTTVSTDPLDEEPPDVYASLKLMSLPPPKEEFITAIRHIDGKVRKFDSRPRLACRPSRWICDVDSADLDGQPTWCGPCQTWFLLFVDLDPASWFISHMKEVHYLRVSRRDSTPPKKRLPQPARAWRSPEGQDLWNTLCGVCGESRYNIPRWVFADRWFAHIEWVCYFGSASIPPMT